MFVMHPAAYVETDGPLSLTTMSLKSSSSAAKRIMTEMKEMQADDSSEFTAAPLEVRKTQS